MTGQAKCGDCAHAADAHDPREPELLKCWCQVSQFFSRTTGAEGKACPQWKARDK